MSLSPFISTPGPEWNFLTSGLNTSSTPGIQTGPPGSIRNDNISIQFFPRWYEDVTLSWSVPASWGSCKYHVYYEEGNLEWNRLTGSLISQTYFKDSTSRDYSKTRRGAYIVEAHLPGGTVVRSVPSTWEYKNRSNIAKISSEIQRREYMLLSRFTGIKSYVFKKIRWGQRCPRCWNPKLEKVMDDNCTVCFGTGFNGGYFNPLPLFLQYEPTSDTKHKGYAGDLEILNINAWTISWPEINPGDVIIRLGDYSTFKVIVVSQTELQSNTVRQIVNLTQCARVDVENYLAERIEDPKAADYLKEMTGRYVQNRFPGKLLDNNVQNDPQWLKDMNNPALPKYKI